MKNFHSGCEATDLPPRTEETTSSQPEYKSCLRRCAGQTFGWGWRPCSCSWCSISVGTRLSEKDSNPDHVNASSAFRFTRRHFVVRIEEKDRSGVAARNKVQRGQVFRDHQELTGAAFAGEAAKTLAELRRQRPQARDEGNPT